MFPAFPAHSQPAILRIWQEAHTIVTENAVVEYLNMIKHHLILAFMQSDVPCKRESFLSQASFKQPSVQRLPGVILYGVAAGLGLALYYH